MFTENGELMKGYAYILRCGDCSFYVGSTKYPEARFAQHQAGQGGRWTAQRLPVEVVHIETYEHIGIAFKREHQLKKWSRSKKKALIEGRIGDLEALAKCRVKLRHIVRNSPTWEACITKYTQLLEVEDIELNRQ